ncbi:PfkB family carbohydrate kinase [Roseiarcus sp.]|uniref:PfkB family carbohydrate kinase n=1 Tax=Roseiarcus sp. TaxID=1969460 RepID=UPI003F9D2E70
MAFRLGRHQSAWSSPECAVRNLTLPERRSLSTSHGIWSLVDLVVVNRGEAVELGCREDPLAAARALREMGAGSAALTLGAQGAAFVTADGDVRFEAPAAAAVDTVGAGDVFCGALIAARASGRAWSGSFRIAVEAAAIAVTRRGVLASFPTCAEMARLFSRWAQEEPRT